MLAYQIAYFFTSTAIVSLLSALDKTLNFLSSDILHINDYFGDTGSIVLQM